MRPEDYRKLLREKGLKVTPQRLAVFEAVDLLHNHPTADEVSQSIRKKHPDIATGTVYKTLDILAEKEILKRVKTDSGLLRYDAVNDKHHHIYCSHCNRIEDYYDSELTALIYSHFERKQIPDFKIWDIKLEIVGEYTEKRESVSKAARRADNSNSARANDNQTDNRNAAGKTGGSTEKKNRDRKK